MTTRQNHESVGDTTESSLRDSVSTQPKPAPEFVPFPFYKPHRSQDPMSNILPAKKLAGSIKAAPNGTFYPFPFFKAPRNRKAEAFLSSHSRKMSPTAIDGVDRNHIHGSLKCLMGGPCLGIGSRPSSSYPIEQDGTIQTENWETTKAREILGDPGFLNATKLGLAAVHISLPEMNLSGFCVNQDFFVTAAHMCDGMTTGTLESLLDKDNTKIWISQARNCKGNQDEDVTARSVYLVAVDEDADIAILCLTNKERARRRRGDRKDLFTVDSNYLAVFRDVAPVEEVNLVWCAGYNGTMEGKGLGCDYDAWWNDHWDSFSIGERHEWRTFLPAGNPVTDPPIPYDFSKLFSPNTRSIAFGLSQENMPSHHSISVWYGKSGAMFCVLKRKCQSKEEIQVRIVGLIQGGIKGESKNKAVMFTPDQVQWICAIANKDQVPEALSDEERFKLKPEKESAWALLGQVRKGPLVNHGYRYALAIDRGQRSRATNNNDWQTKHQP